MAPRWPAHRPCTSPASDVTGPDQDWFAPGQFTTLSDADALNAAVVRAVAGRRTDRPVRHRRRPAATITVKVKQIRIPAPPVLTGTFTLPPWLVLGGVLRTGGVVAAVSAPALT